MADLTAAEKTWIKKQKLIDEKKKEIIDSAKGFDSQITTTRSTATSQIKDLENQKFAARDTLVTELEALGGSLTE